jgi:ribosomal protein L39E
MGKKDLHKKKRLASAHRKGKSGRVPAFVMIRTNRAITFNSHRRDWRTDKLSKKEKE